MGTGGLREQNLLNARQPAKKYKRQLIIWNKIHYVKIRVKGVFWNVNLSIF